MTARLEQAIAHVSTLPEEEQEFYASLLLAELDLDDAPVPQWQKDLLDERMAEHERDPEDVITLDELTAFLNDRRRAR